MEASQKFEEHPAAQPAAVAKRGHLIAVQNSTRAEQKPHVDDTPYHMRISDWSEPKISIVKAHGSVIGREETSLISFETEELGRTSSFIFRKTIPDETHWTTSVDFTLPLATRVEGFNTYISHKLAAQHMHSRMIGTNRSRGFSLLHDTQAALHILSADDQAQLDQQSVSCDAGTSLMIGYSMGDMKQLIALGLAPRMNRSIVASIGFDPCMAERVDYPSELAHLPELALYLGREAIEVSKIFGKNLVDEPDIVRGLRRLRHFAGSFALSPQGISNTVDKWKTIATGETGQYLAEIPEEALVIIHFFDKSHFNNNEVYQSALSHLPYFRYQHEAGWHLSGADPKVIGRLVAKVALALELLAQDLPPGVIADALDTPVLTP